MAEIWGAVTAAVIGVGATAYAASQTPGAPDFAAANREGVMADIETLPLRRMIEQASRLGTSVLKEGYTVRQVSQDASVTAAQTRLSELEAKLKDTPNELPGAKDPAKPWQSQPAKPNPEYDTLQSQLTQAKADLTAALTKAGTTGQLTPQYYDAKGNPVSKNDALLADFTGFGDIDLARKGLEFQTESADKTAGAMLAVQQKYGPEFIAQRLKELELSDPEGFKLRKDMGVKVAAELEQGYKLAPGMREEVEQATRAAQAARGNVLGAAPAAAEAMEVGNAGFRLWQQRLANASSFLSGTTPVAQFGQISGGQAGAAPFAPQNITAGIGVNQNAGQQGAQFAQQSYNAQLSAPNPWATLFTTTAAGAQQYAFDRIGKKP
jgi:hypothetical protein